MEKRKIMWDQYDRIYDAEVEELQRVLDAFLLHVHGSNAEVRQARNYNLAPCTECNATIDAEDETITGSLCEIGRSGAEILEEHGNWTWDRQTATATQQTNG